MHDGHDRLTNTTKYRIAATNKMSLCVTVGYEPDGSPSLRDRRLNLQVSRLQTAGNLCKEVYEQIKGELKNPLEDYSLYWPEQKQWLPPRKQIGLVHLRSGAVLEFKAKKRYLRVRFLDASSKLVRVDETLTVKELLKDLCSQLRLEHPEELSLVVAGDYAVTKHHPAKTMARRVESASPSLTRKSATSSRGKLGSMSAKDLGAKDSPPPLSPSMRRRRPGSASGIHFKKRSIPHKVKKQISKKHQIRLDTPWLDPNKTLAEQEVTEQDELILMYRFYYHMEMERGSANVEMLYKQARATYLAGEFLCSQNDMVRLSAILCQITKGDYVTHRYSPEFLVQIKNLIAPPKCKVKAISKQICAEHVSLKGLSAADAKCWFVKLWSSLELFGMEFFSSTNVDTKDNGLVGVSKYRVMFLFHKKKKNLCWDIDTLVQWKHDPAKDMVTLTFSYEGNTQVLNVHLPDYSGVLVDCLQGHRDLSDSVPDVTRAHNEYQFDEELESAISDFAAQTKKDAKDRRALTSLTYEDIYWACKIVNPLLSDEELAAFQSDSWENPAFENTDLLMDERFSFLDFTEYNSTDTTSGVSSQSPEGSPDPSPLCARKLSDTTNQSPLVKSSHSVENSPRRDKSKPRHGSPRGHLTNGLLDPYFKGTHSRSGSSSSEGISPKLSPNPSRSTGKKEEPSLPQITPTT